MTRFDRTVIVTGGAGFIGSHFLKTFVRKYPNSYFICIDKLNYASKDLHNISDIQSYDNFKFIQLDLTEKHQLFQYLDSLSSITDIINFAAESCVDKSFKDPLYFTYNNILSTQNILEYYRLYSNPLKFIHISTDEVYGEQIENDIVKEDDKLNPTNPYSATKAAIDMIIKSYEYSYNLPITVIRSNNVYGPGQYPEKIIPTAIEKLTMGQPIPIHGDGSNKRSYLYIDDFINAIDLLYGQQTSGVYNVGSPFEMDNLSLVKLIISLYYNIHNNQTLINIDDHITFVKDRNYNDLRYCIDYSKLKNLGWNPTIDLKTGLQTLILL